MFSSCCACVPCQEAGIKFSSVTLDEYNGVQGDVVLHAGGPRALATPTPTLLATPKAAPAEPAKAEPPAASAAAPAAAAGPRVEPSKPLTKPQPETVDEDPREARLRQLGLPPRLASLARRALRGCGCTYLDEPSGTRATATYTIDPSLGHLTVTPSASPSASPADGGEGEVMGRITCPVENIEDIYVIEDGAACFPPKVLAAVQAEERDLLFRVVFKGDVASEVASFCLLEDSHDGRDMLLETLKVVSLKAGVA